LRSRVPSTASIIAIRFSPTEARSATTRIATTTNTACRRAPATRSRRGSSRVELDADTRVHDIALDRFGFARDSEGLTPKAGTTFEFTRKLTGEISVGYLIRAYQDPRLADLRGLIAGASLVWTATALTRVKLTAGSAADESTQPGVSGLFRRDAGIEVDHAFRRSAGDLTNTSGSTGRTSVTRPRSGWFTSCRRTMQLKGELRQSWLRSSVPGADYTATAILVGLRLQR